MKKNKTQESNVVIALQRTMTYFPALITSFLIIRVVEFSILDGLYPEIIIQSIKNDLASLARYLPGLTLISLLPLLLPYPKISNSLIFCFWSLVICIQALLVQYFLTSGVPLGADIFGYSYQELRLTLSHAFQVSISLTIGLIASLTVLWFFIFKKRINLISFKASMLILIGSILALILVPAQSKSASTNNINSLNLSLNKSAYFYDENLNYLIKFFSIKNQPKKSATEPKDKPVADQNLVDPKYPFLHLENTQDSLGPFFNIDPEHLPNFVFIIVEGLGRDFSGPDARLGSFTPFLDSLIDKSLYWDNFLATQGRTFGVIPSIFSSAPFGQHGLTDDEREIPLHNSFLNVVKNHGYQTRYYSGTDPSFDNAGKYFISQKIDKLFSKKDFDIKYRTANEWGYSDKELMQQVVEEEEKELHKPFVSIIQTITMHSPFSFMDDRAYESYLDKHINYLKISKNKYSIYMKDKKIYKTILYTDDAVNLFFSAINNQDSYKNTIFIITGDHRLPEIEMDSVIDRYHVPLLIFSPLLKQPQRIKSVSSHFDIAPSLLAFLSNNYAIKTPKYVTWMGDGLDMEPSFRNLHSYPLKQTKVNLVDYVDKEWFLNQGKLYKLNDGFNIDLTTNSYAAANAKERFDEFIISNDSFSISGKLIPDNLQNEMISYVQAERNEFKHANLSTVSHVITEVADLGGPTNKNTIKLSVVFKNNGDVESQLFIPLLVISDINGKEIMESYGHPLAIDSNAEKSVEMSANINNLTAGEYFISVIPSHPDTGKPVGTGRYHIKFTKAD